MSGRGLWVLLVLAAVFSMHGIQCMAADPSTGAAAGHASVTTAAVDGGHRTATHPAADAHAAGAVLLVAEFPLDGHAQHPTSGHDLWMACLAVLVGGLVLLGLLALVRGSGARCVRGSPSRNLSTLRRSGLPRPPDLSALCLLRI